MCSEKYKNMLNVITWLRALVGHLPKRLNIKFVLGKYNVYPEINTSKSSK